VSVPLVTNLANNDALTRLLRRIRAGVGPADVLANNAGYAVWKSLEETSIGEWDHTFGANLRAATELWVPRCARYAGPGFG
jgi:NAD(P)-dependent dehydrogenase (short-subunit alcohol dehydrogenase family)